MPGTEQARECLQEQPEVSGSQAEQVMLLAAAQVLRSTEASLGAALVPMEDL